MGGATTLVLLFVLAPKTSAQMPEHRVASALRVEWDRASGGAGIAGYVYNDSPYRIGLVRLRLALREDPDRHSGEMLAWVHGNVPARGRWPFSVRGPAAGEVVGVTIESFSLIALEKTAESP